MYALPKMSLNRTYPRKNWLSFDIIMRLTSVTLKRLVAKRARLLTRCSNHTFRPLALAIRSGVYGSGQVALGIACERRMFFLQFGQQCGRATVVDEAELELAAWNDTT